ncbi:acyltransferase [Peribacillus sp. SCS-155]|uniref:acyltransferase n=1 Tax=Peribacillus sedimenti TaxID=3115297 RepID=UPI003906C043
MQNRVVYADLLRVIATMAVIIIHVSAVGFDDLNPTSFEWNVLNIYDSIVRWCVPIFVMLSGMFFLNIKRDISVKSIYFKSIIRILTALLVWAFIYEFYKKILYKQEPLDTNFLYETLLSIIQGNTHYHLWFLYMIIGIYIIAPILRVFIRNAKKSDIEYFLLIAFVFSSLLPTLGHFYPFNLISPFLENFDVNVVLGYVMYFVAGYYFSRFDLSKSLTRVIYTLGIFFAFFTILATVQISVQKGAPDVFFYKYLRANVFFTSIALFIFAKNILNKREFRQPNLRIIYTLSKYSFGMYLVHDMIRTLLMKAGFFNITFNPVFSIPLLAICIFILSFIAAYLIRKIPYIGERIT